MKPYILQLHHLLANTAGIKGLSRGAVLFLAMLLTSQIYAAEEKYDVLYVMSSQAPAFMTFKEAVESRQTESATRRNKQHFVVIDHFQAAKLKELVNNTRVVITLGKKSMRDVAALGIDTPHIATLITREDYREQLSEQDAPHDKHCALVIDQPLTRITRIIQDRLPDARIAGIIETTKEPIISNSSELPQQNNKLGIIRTSLDKNIHSTIQTLSNSGVDIIIALHNKKIYNRNTARNILISSYHFNLPLIGYSSAFVKAGALVGIYSTPESMAGDALDLIKNTDRCHTGNIFHPSKYTVEVNPQVAKSLGINIDTSDLKQTYQDRLRK